MSPIHSNSTGGLKLAKGLLDEREPFPVVYVDCRERDLSRPDDVERVGEVLRRALETAGATLRVGDRVLHKVHIGEPKCTTRMRPSLVAPMVDYTHRAGDE